VPSVPSVPQAPGASASGILNYLLAP